MEKNIKERADNLRDKIRHDKLNKEQETDTNTIHNFTIPQRRLFEKLNNPGKSNGSKSSGSKRTSSGREFD